MRSLSLPTHSLLELLGGVALIGAAVGLGLSATGTVIALVAGVLLTGLALAGPDSLPLRSHRAFDRALVAAMAAGAVVAGSTGDGLAALVLAPLAALLLAVTSATRWSRPY